MNKITFCLSLSIMLLAAEATAKIIQDDSTITHLISEDISLPGTDGEEISVGLHKHNQIDLKGLNKKTLDDDEVIHKIIDY